MLGLPLELSSQVQKNSFIQLPEFQRILWGKERWSFEKFMHYYIFCFPPHTLCYFYMCGLFRCSLRRLRSSWASTVFCRRYYYYWCVYNIPGDKVCDKILFYNKVVDKNLIFIDNLYYSNVFHWYMIKCCWLWVSYFFLDLCLFRLNFSRIKIWIKNEY